MHIHVADMFMCQVGTNIISCQATITYTQWTHSCNANKVAFSSIASHGDEAIRSNPSPQAKMLERPMSAWLAQRRHTMLGRMDACTLYAQLQLPMPAHNNYYFPWQVMQPYIIVNAVARVPIMGIANWVSVEALLVVMGV